MKKPLPDKKAANQKSVPASGGRLSKGKVAGGAALAAAVIIAAINVVPGTVEALGKAKTLTPEKSGIPAGANTYGDSSPAVNGDGNSVNSGTQSGVNAGRDFNGFFNSGSINLSQATKKLQSYRIIAEVEHVMMETVTKEDTKRGETVTAKGFGRSNSTEERYTLPEGAFDVEQRAFWNIKGHSTSATTRIEGNQIVANGTIKSHPLDGARVWGELFIAVKYNINVLKEPVKETLDPRELTEDVVAWSHDKGILKSATLKVYSADGGKLIETIQLARDPLKGDPAQRITAGFIAELGKDTLRVSRAGSVQANR